MSLETASDSAEYTVRRFEPGDRDGILSLLETQWDERPSADWFDWKYREDPYLAHVPITLAEREGDVVAVQGYLPCPIRWGTQVVRALKPVDAVVHPDHRRQGLYTRITEAAIDYYTDGEPAFFFNFPNAASLAAQEKLGWHEVDVVSTFHRVQRPGELLPSDGTPLPLDRAADGLARAYLGVRDRLSTPSDWFEVTRHSSVPADVLESIYESHVPRELHTHREKRLYRWLLDAPGHDHTAYVARHDDRPVASIVTRTVDGRMVDIVDALPMQDGHEAFETLLAAVVTDNVDAAVLSTTGRTLPRELLSRFGFVSFETALLSRLRTPTYMAVRPLWQDEATSLSRRPLTEPANWRLSFLEVKD